MRSARGVCSACAAVVLALASPLAAQDQTTFLVAPDGVLLATDVYLPFGGGPWPAILIRTPYGKDGLWETGELLSVLGFATVTQDTRGRFDSTGEDTVFRDDGEDGRATVDWMTAQDWCDGRIGTFGGSAFAITQYMLAPDAGPALRSIMPVVATPDMYHHAFLQGGALRRSLAYHWLEDQGSLAMYDQLRQHRVRDHWWDPVEVLLHRGQVTAAGLHVGGWYDIFAQGTLDAFAALQRAGGDGARGRQYLVMGPWSHGSLGEREVGEIRFPADAELDLLDLVLPWFNHTLRGWANEVEDWSPVRLFLMGAADEPGAPGNRWIELATWPPPARTQRLYLGADGSLSGSTQAYGTGDLVVDPTDPVPTLGGNNLFPDLEVDGRPMGDGPHDQRPIETRGDVLVFTSEVLAGPLEVVGRVSAVLWLVPDTPDLDLAVRLTDVYPDGRSMLVLDGIQRARMRCSDHRECLLTPGEPIEMTVDLWSTAMVFNAGHRVRVSVSGSNAPRFEVNPNHGGDLNEDGASVTARPQLLFGPEHPSRLQLPAATGLLRAGGRRLAPDRPAR